LMMTLVGSCCSSRFGAEDTKVRRVVVDMGEFQMPLRHGLSLRDSSELSLVMGDSEAEVR
jgi:hypothetical protein